MVAAALDRLNDDDIEIAFQLFLGRPSGGGDALASKRGMSAPQLAATLMASAEFERKVQPALLDRALLPHARLAPTPSAKIADWVDRRFGQSKRIATTWHGLIARAASSPLVVELLGAQAPFSRDTLDRMAERSTADEIDVRHAFRLLLGRTAPAELTAERSGADFMQMMIELVCSSEFETQVAPALALGEKLPHEKRGAPLPTPAFIDWAVARFGPHAAFNAKTATWRTVLVAALDAGGPLGGLPNRAEEAGKPVNSGRKTALLRSGAAWSVDGANWFRGVFWAKAFSDEPPAVGAAPAAWVEAASGSETVWSEVFEPLVSGYTPAHLLRRGPPTRRDIEWAAELTDEALPPGAVGWRGLLCGVIGSRAWIDVLEAAENPASLAYALRVSHWLYRQRRGEPVAPRVMAVREPGGTVAVRPLSGDLAPDEPVVIVLESPSKEARGVVARLEAGEWRVPAARLSETLQDAEPLSSVHGVIYRETEAEETGFPFRIVTAQNVSHDSVDKLTASLSVEGGLVHYDVQGVEAGAMLALMADNAPLTTFASPFGRRLRGWFAVPASETRRFTLATDDGRHLAEVNAAPSDRAWIAGEPTVGPTGVTGWWWSPISEAEPIAVLKRKGADAESPDAFTAVDRRPLRSPASELPEGIPDACVGYHFSPNAEFFREGAGPMRIDIEIGDNIAAEFPIDFDWTATSFFTQLSSATPTVQSAWLIAAADSGRADLVLPALKRQVDPTRSEAALASLLARLLVNTPPNKSALVDEARRHYEAIWNGASNDANRLSRIIRAIGQVAAVSDMAFERRVFPSTPYKDFAASLLVAAAELKIRSVDEYAAVVADLGRLKQGSSIDARIEQGLARHPRNHRLLSMAATRAVAKGEFSTAAGYVRSAIAEKESSADARRARAMMEGYEGRWSSQLSFLRGSGSAPQLEPPQALARPAIPLGWFDFAERAGLARQQSDASQLAADAARVSRAGRAPADFSYSVFVLSDEDPFMRLDEPFRRLAPRCMLYTLLPDADLDQAPALGDFTFFFRTLKAAASENIRFILEQMSGAVDHIRVEAARNVDEWTGEPSLVGFGVANQYLKLRPLGDFETAATIVGRALRAQIFSL